MTEVLIIGGGIIGLSLARELKRKGLKQVTILEKNSMCGAEASNAAAGMLAPQAEADKLDDFFRFCAESRDLYENFAAELFVETGVDIELNKSGTLYLALTEIDSEEIVQRYQRQKNAGLKVDLLSANDAKRFEPFVSTDVRESLFFPDDWQVENRKLIHALDKFAEFNEMEIFENTEIKSLIIENCKIIGADTGIEKFYAEKVVLTAGAWTSLIETENFVLPKVRPIRGQMISFHTAKQLFERVIYSPRGYLVPRRDGRILIGATVEDVGFDKQVTLAGIEYLRETAFEIAPSLANLEISETWTSFRPFCNDALPILGEISGIENLYIATGHYRNGILLAPLTAKLLAEKIVEDKTSDYLRLFNLNRFQKSIGT